MKVQKITSFELDKNLIPLTKKQPSKVQNKRFPFYVCYTIAFISLIAFFIYSKQHNTSISSNYFSLKKEYDRIDNENSKYKEKMDSTRKQREEVMPQYQDISNTLSELSKGIQHFSNEIGNNRNSLLNRKAEVKKKRQDLDSKFREINERELINITTLNYKLFNLSNFTYKAQGIEFTSNIIRSIEEIRFIEEATGYKLDKPCYQSLLVNPDSMRLKQSCMGASRTLSLFLTKYNTRFGGFTTLDLAGNTRDYDKEAFLINLDKRKIWRSLPGHSSLTNDKNSLCFGDNDLKYNIRKYSINKYFQSYENNEFEWELNGGYEDFCVTISETFILVKP